MLNIINSIQLGTIIPRVQEVFFDRDLVTEDEAEIKIEIQTSFSQDDEENPGKLKLSFQVVSYAKTDEENFSFKCKLEVDYHFNIISVENYKAMSREDCVALCSNLTFLDFRRRLINMYASLGMSGVKIPLSLTKFSGDLESA